MRFGRLIRMCGLFGLTAAAAVALAQAPDPAKTGVTPSTYRSYIVADQRSDVKDIRNRTGKIEINRGVAAAGRVDAHVASQHGTQRPVLGRSRRGGVCTRGLGRGTGSGAVALRILDFGFWILDSKP